MVFRGTSVAQGSGQAVVTATGIHTEMGAIAQMLASVEDAPTPLQREITKVSKVLGIAVLIIAVVVIVALVLLGNVHTVEDFIETLLLGVSLAVAAVPEGRRSCRSSWRWVCGGWPPTMRWSEVDQRPEPWRPLSDRQDRNPDPLGMTIGKWRPRPGRPW